MKTLFNLFAIIFAISLCSCSDKEESIIESLSNSKIVKSIIVNGDIGLEGVNNIRYDSKGRVIQFREYSYNYKNGQLTVTSAKDNTYKIIATLNDKGHITTATMTVFDTYKREEFVSNHKFTYSPDGYLTHSSDNLSTGLREQYAYFWSEDRNLQKIGVGSKYQVFSYGTQVNTTNIDLTYWTDAWGSYLAYEGYLGLLGFLGKSSKNLYTNTDGIDFRYNFNADGSLSEMYFYLDGPRENISIKFTY